MKYAVLKQRHEEYQIDIWEEIEALYKGGYTVVRDADRFLPRMADEHEEIWKLRKQSTGYLGYIGQIIDEFVSGVFLGGLTVSPAKEDALADGAFWEAFKRDADFSGTPFDELMKGVLRTALKKRRSYIAIDFPRVDEIELIKSRADEDRIGASRAYAYELPPEQVVDWKLDKFGKFEWVILYRLIQERRTPESTRDGSRTHEYKIWRDTPDGTATYEVWRFVETKDNPLTDDSDFTLATPPTETSFDQIPIIRCELPEGLWAGNKLGTVQLEHHRRRSCLNAAMGKSLVAIPYVKLGSEIGAPGGPMPAEVSMNPHRGNDPVAQFRRKGFLALGAQDEVGFAEPGGSAYQITREDLIDLKNEMFRVVHQMAAAITATKSQAGASGDSKREDRASEAIVIDELGDLVRKWARDVYDAVAKARQESIVWEVKGLDGFDTDDRSQVIEEAIQVDQLAIDSPTFKREYKTELAQKILTSATPATLEAIRREIKASVEAEAELAAARRAAEKKQLGGGSTSSEAPPPGRGANGAPPRPAA